MWISPDFRYIELFRSTTAEVQQVSIKSDNFLFLLNYTHPIVNNKFDANYFFLTGFKSNSGNDDWNADDNFTTAADSAATTSAHHHLWN